MLATANNQPIVSTIGCRSQLNVTNSASFPVLTLQCVPSYFSVAPCMFSFIITDPVFLFFSLLFCIDSLLLSFVSLLNQGLCMVPIKGPAVPVPDDAIMASCVGTAFCAALQCTCLGLFGLLY